MLDFISLFFRSFRDILLKFYGCTTRAAHIFFAGIHAFIASYFFFAFSVWFSHIRGKFCQTFSHSMKKNLSARMKKHINNGKQKPANMVTFVFALKMVFFTFFALNFMNIACFVCLCALSITQPVQNQLPIPHQTQTNKQTNINETFTSNYAFNKKKNNKPSHLLLVVTK